LFSQASGANAAANPNANATTQAVLDYIASRKYAGSTERLITGQQIDNGIPTENNELVQLQAKTGKLPAIFADAAGAGYYNISDQLPYWVGHWNKGGLLSLFFAASNPETGTRYFNLGMNDFSAVITPGTSSYNNYRASMDAVAAELQLLEDRDIPVLFRVFPEMNGGWFWWGGRDPNEFKTLWIQTFNYFTYTKGLDNLLWVYAPNLHRDSDSMMKYYPGDQYVDIVGADFYAYGLSQDFVDSYNALLNTGKPFALTEYGYDAGCAIPYDFNDFRTNIKLYYPQTAYVIFWNSGCSPASSMNSGTYELLNDPWMANAPLPISGGTYSPPSASSSCHLYDSSQAVTDGFGAASNVLTTAKEVLLKATCSDTSVSFQIGNGSARQYMYNEGYFWDGSNWQNFTLSCSNLVSDVWCVGNTSYTQSLTPSQLQNTNYYAAYVCTWTGTEWKCGCRDSACATNYWNLQAFRK
jgi:mannan endo-1,4-beta-mannosidase